MGTKRDSRAWRTASPETPEPGSMETLRIPPPSRLLMEHLWEQFGVSEPIPLELTAEQTFQANAVQAGIVEVLRYLDELLNGEPQK